MNTFTYKERETKKSPESSSVDSNDLFHNSKYKKYLLKF